MQFSFITRPLLFQMKMHSFRDKITLFAHAPQKVISVNEVREARALSKANVFGISVYKYIIIIHLFVYMLDNKSSKSIYGKYKAS